VSRPHYRICVVCTGNICRSPMAEWLLREALEDAGLADRVVVDSAGTSSEERGNPMDRRTVAALRRRGHVDGGWSGHRARRFDRRWFEEIDLVLAADSGHARALQRLAPSTEDAEKVRLLRSFDPGSVAAGALDMDDPWWGDEASFDQTYDEVRAAVPGVVEHVRRALGSGQG
jgi:protein-tyrosine phosphatase